MTDTAKHPLADTPEYRKYEALAKKNAAKSQMLAVEFGIQLQDESMLLGRVEALLDTVLPRESMERLDFEMKFQQSIERSLEEAHNAGVQQRKAMEKMQREQTLLAGVPGVKIR